MTKTIGELKDEVVTVLVLISGPLAILLIFGTTTAWLEAWDKAWAELVEFAPCDEARLAEWTMAVTWTISQLERNALLKELEQDDE